MKDRKEPTFLELSQDFPELVRIASFWCNLFLTYPEEVYASEDKETGSVTVRAKGRSCEIVIKPFLDEVWVKGININADSICKAVVLSYKKWRRDHQVKNLLNEAVRELDENNS